MRRLHSASTQDTEEDGFEHRLRRKIDEPFSPITQISIGYLEMASGRWARVVGALIRLASKMTQCMMLTIFKMFMTTMSAAFKILL